MLGWMQDPGLPSMFAPTAGNQSSDNLLSAVDLDPAHCRYQWNGCFSTLGDMQAAGGDTGSRFVSDEQRVALLTAQDIPSSPNE